MIWGKQTETLFVNFGLQNLPCWWVVNVGNLFPSTLVLQRKQSHLLCLTEAADKSLNAGIFWTSWWAICALNVAHRKHSFQFGERVCHASCWHQPATVTHNSNLVALCDKAETKQAKLRRNQPSCQPRWPDSRPLAQGKLGWLLVTLPQAKSGTLWVRLFWEENGNLSLNYLIF